MRHLVALALLLTAAACTEDAEPVGPTMDVYGVRRWTCEDPAGERCAPPAPFDSGWPAVVLVGPDYLQWLDDHHPAHVSRDGCMLADPGVDSGVARSAYELCGDEDSGGARITWGEGTAQQCTCSAALYSDGLN